MITIPDSGACHIGNTFPAGYKDRKPPVPIRSHLRVFGLVHGVLSCSELRLLTQVVHNVSRGQLSVMRLAQTLIFLLTTLLLPYNIVTILPLFYLHFIPKWRDTIMNQNKILLIHTVNVFCISHKLNVKNLIISILILCVWEGVWDEVILKLQNWANINVIYSKIHV